MKFFKLLGLTAFVAAGLLTSASNATADTVTSPPGTVYTGGVKATSTHTSFHPGDPPNFLTVTCEESILEGTIGSHGGAEVGIPLSKLSFNKCGNDTVTTLKTGSLSANATGGSNGLLRSSGLELRLHTSEGPVCTLTTSGHGIGDLSGGAPATISLGSQNLHLTGFLCPKTAVWTGDYTVNTPNPLTID